MRKDIGREIVTLEMFLDPVIPLNAQRVSFRELERRSKTATETKTEKLSELNIIS